jgi:cytochrome c553
MRIPWFSYSLVLVVTACEGAPPPPPPPPYRPVVDVRELMAAVLEPAADAYWDAVGSIDDKNGTTNIRPQTPGDWETVRRSAVVVAEAGNLLMMPTRARDDGDWMTFSRAMIDAATGAIAAAAAKNPEAVFDAGAQVYDTCTQCHAKYAVEQSRPNGGKL